MELLNPKSAVSVAVLGEPKLIETLGTYQSWRLHFFIYLADEAMPSLHKKTTWQRCLSESNKWTFSEVEDKTLYLFFPLFNSEIFFLLDIMKSKSNPDILKMAAAAAKRSERTMRSKVSFLHT